MTKKDKNNMIKFPVDFEFFDKEKFDRGDYCQKQSPGCCCKTGWRYEDLCPDCRDKRDPGKQTSYCECPPVERIFAKRADEELQ